MPNKGATGLPVDQSGGPTVDPTSNVLQLVAAANKRGDDLREAERRRTDDLMECYQEHIKEVLTLRASYDEKLDTAEAKRIDAIRAVDVGAVAVAAERAAQQATVLAAQVATSAETLRTLVATSAAALATQQAATIEPITARLAALERSSYEGAGKSGVTDPAMAQLAADMRAVSQSLAQGSGNKQGALDSRTLMFAVVGSVFTLAAITVAIVSLVTR